MQHRRLCIFFTNVVYIIVFCYKMVVSLLVYILDYIVIYIFLKNDVLLLCDVFFKNVTHISNMTLKLTQWFCLVILIFFFSCELEINLVFFVFKQPNIVEEQQLAKSMDSVKKVIPFSEPEFLNFLHTHEKGESQRKRKEDRFF